MVVILQLEVIFINFLHSLLKTIKQKFLGNSSFIAIDINLQTCINLFLKFYVDLKVIS